jgi:hypothetical protein
MRRRSLRENGVKRAGIFRKNAEKRKEEEEEEKEK